MKIRPGSDLLPGRRFLVLLSGFGVVRRVEPREEGIKRTAVELFEREQHAHAHIALARFVFGIGRAANVAAAALQLGAQLPLFYAAAATKAVRNTGQKKGMSLTPPARCRGRF